MPTPPAQATSPNHDEPGTAGIATTLRDSPGMRPQKREVVYKHVEKLLTLRNRIAHHEPIHRLPLADLHDRMLLVITWIDPSISGWLSDLSRVPSLLASRPDSRSED